MIYAIVGPTGVGKTKLSIMLAKKLNASIINCDSMQIYKELNIGVAKIKEEEKEGIEHYLFDIISIDDDFNVYDYQKLAREKIKELLSMNKNIIIVGGTGLYLKALLYDYNFDNTVATKKIYNAKIIGLKRDRKTLYDDINKRVDIMFDEGLLNEVKLLYKNHKNSRALNCAIGYKEIIEYLNKDITLEEAKEKIKKASRRYAKRQYTFFNNQFQDIKWYDTLDNSFDNIIQDILS